MSNIRHAAERWRYDYDWLDADAHHTVQQAPVLVANNQPMIVATKAIILRYQQETRDLSAALTVRQIFYQLIEAIGLQNTEANYQKVSDVLTAARLENVIPWQHITDRSRAILRVSMWPTLSDFADAAEYSYRGDVWATQEQRILFWVEKDARAAWVQQIVAPYGIAVVPGRGATSWGLIREVADLLDDGYGWSVLYLGDFDPSGLMIGEHNRTALAALHCRPEWRLLSVRHEDMQVIPRAAWQDPKEERYDATKGRIVRGDPNTKRFLARYGRDQKCAEVDSMPPALLRARILSAVHSRLDTAAWRRRMRLDSAEKAAVQVALSRIDTGDYRQKIAAEACLYGLAYYNREDVEAAERERDADYQQTAKAR